MNSSNAALHRHIITALNFVTYISYPAKKFSKRIQGPEPWIDGRTDEKASEAPCSHANWITLCEVGNTEHNPIL